MIFWLKNSGDNNRTITTTKTKIENNNKVYNGKSVIKTTKPKTTRNPNEHQTFNYFLYQNGFEDKANL